MKIVNWIASISLGLLMLNSSAADPITGGQIIKTKPKLDPANPLKPAGENDPALLQLREDVVCKVKLTVGTDGVLGDFSVTQSSGIAEIDQLCLKAFVGGKLLPATENGVPVIAVLEIPVTWRRPK
jgi:outer membrane biosynthesis protein TonB